MSSFVTKHHAALLAVALGLCAAPTVALGAPHGEGRPGAAAKGDDVYPEEANAEGRRERRFPMEGKRFLELVNKRLQGFEQRLDERLKKHKLPAALEREIRAEAARSEAQVREAARKAAADSKVTKDEAWEVRELALELREQARAKYGPKVRAARRHQSVGGPGPKQG